MIEVWHRREIELCKYLMYKKIDIEAIVDEYIMTYSGILQEQRVSKCFINDCIIIVWIKLKSE